MSDKKASNPAVVVLSGGQDSVTCLGIALKEHEKVHAITFVYGQKHEIEVSQAQLICYKHQVPLKLFDLRAFGALVTSALTSDGDTTKPHAYKPGLPASFVPNRNAMFLTIAHAWAQEVGANIIFTGVCQTDYSGYPDCRRAFIDQLEFALNIGYETAIVIRTPLMYLTKAETFAFAEEVGILETVIEDSHTCYNGDRSIRHAWGYGCGHCPACQLREKGWNEFKAV